MFSVGKTHKEAGMASYQENLSVGTAQRYPGSSYKVPCLGECSSRDWVPLSSYSGTVCGGWPTWATKLLSTGNV